MLTHNLKGRDVSSLWFTRKKKRGRPMTDIGGANLASLDPSLVTLKIRGETSKV